LLGDGIRVIKDGNRFFKLNAMLAQIAGRFRIIPFKMLFYGGIVLQKSSASRFGHGVAITVTICSSQADVRLATPKTAPYSNSPTPRNSPHWLQPATRDSGLLGKRRKPAPLFGMGYVKSEQPITAQWLKEQSFEIEIGWQRYPAEASLRPFYDPDGLRIKA